MTREETTIQALRNHIEVLEENIKALEQEVKMRDATPEERESIDKYIKSISTTVQEPKYCDRNICISNEYNGIGCDECEVTKSQKKVLEKELCKDCVSKKELIIKISENYQSFPVKNEEYGKAGILFENLMPIINELPPVIPVRKKGKWKNGDPICPCCGEDKFKDLDADIWSDWQPKFCPNCGSFMEVER